MRMYTSSSEIRSGAWSGSEAGSFSATSVIFIPSLNRGKESRGACPAEGRVGCADAPMRSVSPILNAPARRGNRQVPSHALNSLVYTLLRDYNAQDVGARTLVRPPAGMPPGRNGRRGLPRLEPGPAGGRPVARRGRAQAPAGGRRPDPGHAGGRAPRAPVADPIGRRRAALGTLRP